MDAYLNLSPGNVVPENASSISVVCGIVDTESDDRRQRRSLAGGAVSSIGTSVPREIFEQETFR